MGWITFKEHSFRECIESDPDLAAMRDEYARKPAGERRMAADWEYHSAIAGGMFNDALAMAGQPAFAQNYWPEGILALAIDPLFAPAILTVGSMEYQLGRENEAMELFMTLTTLPPDEPDLPEIIDKAGDFLTDEEDYVHARDLYAVAEKAFPDVAVYPTGLCYCFGKLGLYEDAVAKARRTNELEPDNYLHMNDLGWALYEAGYLDQAVESLKKSVAVAPEDYELARNNMEIVRKAQGKTGARKRTRKGKSRS